MIDPDRTLTAVALPWAQSALTSPEITTAAASMPQAIHGIAPPQVPESDRHPLDLDALVSATVALDVLISRTKRIQEHPAMLVEITRVALDVGAHGGLEEQGAQELLLAAMGAAGQCREKLCSAWARDREESSPLLAPPTDPKTVAEAMRRLEDGARAAIGEVRLILDTVTEVDYRPA
ncbi:MAG: hypothetical protein AAFP04_11985 [Myxococcota bacterium]